MPASNLIIVESPSKARTLSKFLGSDYDVRASMGHVVDLPHSKLGIDIEHGFEPDYIVIKGKEGQLRDLKAAARKSKRVLLAADPDREGEAIAWHIARQLGLTDPERIVFREITKQAVETAIDQPRPIDQRLVDAQQARRVIDRLLGYKLSPLLWRKIRKGLSAGRVQSVALRLVCDREQEIEAFTTVESWSLEALLLTDSQDQFKARYQGIGLEPKGKRGKAKEEDGQPAGMANEASARRVMAEVEKAEFRVASVERRRLKRNPPQPYITSTLQQDASSQLHFSPSKTMRIAQQLYEGVELGSAGPAGLITYMRTDSPRLSDSAVAGAKTYVEQTFGTQYLGQVGAQRRGPKAAVASQDAHEAVRPTSVERDPDQIQEYLSADQAKLYRLVWRRFLSSQMSPAEFDSTRAEVMAGEHRFRATGSQLIFDGYLRVAGSESREDELLPEINPDQVVSLKELTPEQHFSQPPPRYSEASLVKELEERGIGRPSTYATMTELIQTRRYVVQQERRLHPTPLGLAVNEALTTQFPSVVDLGFTAALELKLDSIEAGESPWVPVVSSWYEPFSKVLDEAQESMPRVKIKAQPTGGACPKCGADLVMRSGRFGDFVGCSRYPECDFIEGKEERAAAEEIGEACPLCSKPLVKRTGRRGPFVGCSGYPSCRFIRTDAGASGAAGSAAVAEPTGESCPDCGKELVQRKGRFGPFVSCSGYPGCKYRPPKEASGAAPAGKAPARSRRSPAKRGVKEPVSR
ncbi:MAG TPA: type I DNA topoisomerase [Candidatus Dormibacteraeota bacterium]|nr:type I DNA topoisomerase [Candidatus Dormibacteraeota bacterium]